MKSRLLHDLLLKLRLLKTRAGRKIHFVHVVGTRMIDQGSDGLSRGNLMEGVTGGKAMEFFVPLEPSSEAQAFWIGSSLGHRSIAAILGTYWNQMIGLTKGTMYQKAPKIVMAYGYLHKKGNFIWAPPPTVADAALAATS